MSGPRAVVIPFGVPAEARGLGLGLAALVHGFVQLDRQNVGLAQLMGKRSSEPGATPPGPVEAFVPPQAWRDLAGTGNAPPNVDVVLTGALEPPAEGKGMIQLLAYDATDGSTRARVELHLDGVRAGATLVSALEEVWGRVGGDLGPVRDLGELAWEPLESVLLGERCLLYDPGRNGPHDRLAAMLHLGRAVGDAPEAKYPASRLAAVAFESAMAPSADSRLADAALRALVRASEDAPSRLELLEASLALQVRRGDTAVAEARAAAALRGAPDRPRLHAVLSEARRALGNLDGALAAVDRGLACAPDDTALLTERGLVLVEQGRGLEAERAWTSVLAREPLQPAAYSHLAMLAMTRKDTPLAQSLVDQALAARAAHPEVLRRAIQLAMAAEADGIARAARVASLASALVERVPADGWACLMLARASLQTGDKARAAEQLGRVQLLAPDSVFAAEAQRGLFALSDPQGAMELESVLRAANGAEEPALEFLSARARHLATTHSVWSIWYAVGVVEARRHKWRAAREALERAVSLAGGATPAHAELVGACIALGDAEAGLLHAQRALALDGQTPRTLGLLATALLEAGRRDEAATAIADALRRDPSDAANEAIAERIRKKPEPPPGWLERWRRKLLGGP